MRAPKHEYWCKEQKHYLYKTIVDAHQLKGWSEVYISETVHAETATTFSICPLDSKNIYFHVIHENKISIFEQTVIFHHDIVILFETLRD